MSNKSLYDQMRDDIHQVYHDSRASSKLQGIPTETLDLIRESSLAAVNNMESEVKVNLGCLQRSGLVKNINEPK